jgi:ABC-type phosphate/phosphonate transport system substrate-binding protein
MQLKHAIAGVALWMISLTASAATFTLAVEPTYTPEQAQEVYAPLLAYLNKSTGHTFTLRVAPSFNRHWHDIQTNAAVDFAFEEAHFADYRRQSAGFVLVARTQEDSQYAIVVADQAMANEGASGVVGRRVAGLGAPSMGYVLLFDGFRNPLSQPELSSPGTKWSDGPDLIFSGDVEGAVVPSYLAEENPALMVAWRSRTVPGRALVASPRVAGDVRTRIRDALLKMHEDPAAFAVMNELRTQRIVPADPAAYNGMERLLASQFGYVSPRRAATAAAAAPAATTPVPTETPAN